MKVMFGTTELDLRTLSDDGMIWFDELVAMIGSDTAEMGAVVAKQGGKSDL